MGKSGFDSVDVTTSERLPLFCLVYFSSIQLWLLLLLLLLLRVFILKNILKKEEKQNLF
jgi:hypothetical protein